jgi:hypothetical protein
LAGKHSISIQSENYIFTEEKKQNFQILKKRGSFYALFLVGAMESGAGVEPGGLTRRVGSPA